MIFRLKAFFQTTALGWYISRFLLLQVMLELFRVYFLIVNEKAFPNFSFSDHLSGMFFDFVTLNLFLLPVAAFLFLPIPFVFEKWRRGIVLIILFLIAFFLFFTSAFDIAYFSYINKRLSFDYWIFMLNNEDTSSLADDFILEFWWLIASVITVFAFLFWALKGIPKYPISPSNWKNWAFWVLIIGLMIGFGRGSFQMRPLNVIDATRFASLENAPAVLNAPFVLVKTQNLKGIEPKHFYSQTRADELFNPEKKPNSLQILPPKTNVVVIILESFSGYYVGPEEEKSYTPFLDSIFAHGLYFPNALANGSTSMDGMAAITASIPAWTNETFILSSYSSGCYNGIAGLLGETGYSSAFFHSANNGSMHFDAFSAGAGFQQYFGRNEYPNEAHYDGNWGIFDFYFLPWTAKKMSELPQPFCVGMFNISSHHPYTIPKRFKNQVIKSNDPLATAISFADLSLEEFWKVAQKQPWFENTLFVFSADHVGPSKKVFKNDIASLFQIPIAFYHPKVDLSKYQQNEDFQQIDILPTVLDLVHFPKKYVAFGSSYFETRKYPKWIYSQGNQLMKVGEEWLTVREENWEPKRPEFRRNARVMQAQIQQFYNALVENKLCVDNE
ncbi:MAG: hypothetical protein RL264_2455 [Bacteroidota bacterium]|jgi:phosphoglycerol transferase MdoB-like AlkP superfamily enzyme